MYSGKNFLTPNEEKIQQVIAILLSIRL